MGLLSRYPFENPTVPANYSKPLWMVFQAPGRNKLSQKRDKESDSRKNEE
jgi:hypothetical protein